MGFHSRVFCLVLFMGIVPESHSAERPVLRLADDRIRPVAMVPPGTRPPEGSPAPAPAQASRCQSSRSCVFAKMPVYSQDSDAVESFIAAKEGLGSGYSDPGLCVPTAAAMMLDGILSELHPTTKVAGSKLQEFHGTSDVGAKVWILGKAMGTRFKRGGTLINAGVFDLIINSAYDFFRHYFRFSPAKEQAADRKGGILHFAETTGSEFISSIRTHKYAYLLALAGCEMKSQKNWLFSLTWCPVKLQNAHGLTVNGFDQDRIRINDPWGRIYFVRMTRERIRSCAVCTKNNKTVLTHVSGSSGYVGAYSGGGKKTVLMSWIRAKAY